MRFGLQLTLFLTLTTSLWAQEKDITHSYKHIVTIANEGGKFNYKPMSLLLTPDQRYLLSGTFGRNPVFSIYEMSTGNLIHEFTARGKLTLDRFFFQDNNTLYIGNGRKKVLKIDISSGKHTPSGCSLSDGNICDKLDPSLDVPAWTWRNGHVSEVTHPYRYIIRYTPEKIHMYYNMNRD